jgi:hypothetical protein
MNALPAKPGIGALSKRSGCNIETIRYYERITVHHLDEVRRKLADLRKIERVLSDMATQCDGGTVPRCPIIDALFDRPSRPVNGAVGGRTTPADPSPASASSPTRSRSRWASSST